MPEDSSNFQLFNYPDKPLFPSGQIIRRRIGSKLHIVGDTVFIPSLGYNGTILKFNPHTVNVIPHDYGYYWPYKISDLREGSGISCHIRW